jgi:hypothetical protein
MTQSCSVAFFFGMFGKILCVVRAAIGLFSS